MFPALAAEPRPGARLILEVVSHPTRGRRFVLEAGKPARVGHSERADVVVADDASMSGLHFSVTWDGAVCRVQDLKSNAGTLLDGQAVEQAEVSHRAWIRAGNTDFSVYHEAFTQRRPVASTPEKDAARRLLGEQGHELFAVLDAARAPRVVELLKESADLHQSLYEGLEGHGFARVAPYLVKLSPETSPLLDSLVREGWGQSWGIYLRSRAPFRELRTRLRRLLVVEDEDDEPMVFRFYDPRVLRDFLPECTPRQIGEMFDGVGRFLVEGEGAPEALVYRARPEDTESPLDEERVLLSSPEERISP